MPSQEQVIENLVIRVRNLEEGRAVQSKTIKEQNKEINLYQRQLQDLQRSFEALKKENNRLKSLT